MIPPHLLRSPPVASGFGGVRPLVFTARLHGARLHGAHGFRGARLHGVRPLLFASCFGAVQIHVPFSFRSWGQTFTFHIRFTPGSGS